jgi:dihydroorotase-like cyclic amidohydrolase
MNSLLIVNGYICTTDAITRADIAVCDGIIKEIGTLKASDFPDYQIFNAEGKYIFLQH